MLFIKELKPGLNTQKDSIPAKLFTCFILVSKDLFLYIYIQITFPYSFWLENDVE